jgi:hypothetical protein
MTLDTRIAIRTAEKATPREIFEYCRALLSTPSGTPIMTELDNASGSSRAPGVKEFWHQPGLGLEAWLIMYYSPDGLLTHDCDKFCARRVGWAEWDLPQERYWVSAEDVAEHDADVVANPRECGWADVEISIDTTYSFMNDRGESCSQRHARFIHELGEWLDERGCEWAWQNEYQCQWYIGRDGLEYFGNFHTGTGGPAEWFATKVLPAIATMAGEEL